MQSRIPTLDKLGVTSLPSDLDAKASQIAQGWFTAFASQVEARNVDGILDIFCEDGLWRDANALTWDLRTFDGKSKIKTFLDSQLDVMKMGSFQWREFVRVQKPYPDMVFIVTMFGFQTDVGKCTAVVRLVPTPSNDWKAFTMFSNLDELKDFPEKIGTLRNQTALPGIVWAEHRKIEQEFADTDPTVLIIGGGQSGIELAARLKCLDVSTLIIEKDVRIGDSWRHRYETLCLHFPIWFDHMPYMPFPPTWPKYTPGLKMADWLEDYARILELNIWTSSEVLSAKQEKDNTWTVHVRRVDGSLRVFSVSHLVFATGQGDGVPRIPQFTNQEAFRGEIIHSTKYRRASDYEGKKVIVLGAGNSGHDVASDLACHGVDVTLYQRSSTFVINLDRGWKFLGGALYSEDGPPTAIADLLTHSMPHLLQEGGMAQRAVKAILEDQKDMLTALTAVGYKLNKGILDTGILLLLKQKGGGHYFDIGASQLIIERKIKIKNGTQIKQLDPLGLQFDDGTKLDADVIICATGCGDVRSFIRKICGDDVACDCPPLLGVDDEGEMSWFRALPRRGLRYMHGSLSLNRFYSKHVAMHIKAEEEGIITARYAKVLGANFVVTRA